MQETQKNAGSIPGSGKSPGGGNGNPLQYSCLENIMASGAWWATVHRVSKNWTWLSTHVSPSLIPEALNFLPLQGCMYVLFPWIWVTVYLPLWFSSAQLLSSVQFSSVQLCLTLCNPMDCSTPGLPVHHQLLEFTQTQFIESVMPSNHYNQPLVNRTQKKWHCAILGA